MPTRSDILARIVNLPPSVQGKICEDRRTLADGRVAVYHNLQYWSEGRNHTLRIPEAKLDEFRAAVESGKTARDLIVALGRHDASQILTSASPLKKNSRTSSSAGRRRSRR